MGRNSPKVLSVFDVDPFRIGGTEAYARELSFQLSLQGWESVLCFSNYPARAVLEYLSLPNVQIEVLKEPSNLGWRSVRDLAGIVRKHHPRVLHMQFTPFLSPYPWVARWLGVERIFITDQSSRPGDYIPGRAALLKRLAARMINRPITKVICISDFVHECLRVRDLLPAHRLQRIHNAVDLARAGCHAQHNFCFRKKYSIPDGRPLIVQVSWLIPEKGISDLLKAAKIVLSRHSNVHFVFVGDGEHREKFTGEADELGIARDVTWTGIVTDPLGAGVYAAAEIVCQVSRWQEGFGWTIAEAMACYKPLIGTQVGGIPELIEDGTTGFLVPPGDPAILAQKMQLLLEDGDLRKRMGLAGRKSAERKFDLKKNVKDVLVLYGLAP